jgi:hypothetical protein
MSDKNGCVLTILGALLTALTASSVPWWWHEIVTKQGPKPSPVPTETPEPSPVPTETPEPKPRRTSISLVHESIPNPNRCHLDINISFGNRSIPTIEDYYPGDSILISDIELGQQIYKITGIVHCLPYNSPSYVVDCKIFEEGNVNVVPSGVYYLSFLNRKWDQCSFEIDLRERSVG